MNIRPFAEADAPAVSALIIETMRVSNARDYTEAEIAALVAKERPEDVLERASWTHFYVAEDGGGIVGCGAIGPFWGSLTESCLFSIFVRPDLQGQGVGRAIVAALEADEYALWARRIHVNASITGLGFYRLLGYAFSDGGDRLGDEKLYRLEKINHIT